jgi:hypothetical protein
MRQLIATAAVAMVLLTGVLNAGGSTPQPRTWPAAPWPSGLT